MVHPARARGVDYSDKSKISSVSSTPRSPYLLSPSSTSLVKYNPNVEGDKYKGSSLYKALNTSTHSISHKREYHTSRTLCVNKKISLNTYKNRDVRNRKLHTKYLVNTFSPSYNAINDIILDCKLSNFEKQKRIEGILREF